MVIRLVRPSIEYKESFLTALQDFQVEGLPWYQDLNFAQIDSGFAEYVEKLCAKPFLRTQVLVPETELWGVADGAFAGRISIRHELNDALRVIGGHIGYDTAVAFRGKGVASEMLALALPIAKSLGLNEVLLTCDDTNIASIRVIEKNGGRLHSTKVVTPGKAPKRYYWIKID